MYGDVVTGTIVRFSPPQLLIFLSTSLGIVALASMVAGAAMVRFFKFARRYSVLKYQPSFHYDETKPDDAEEV